MADKNNKNPPESLWRCSTCHFDNIPLLEYCEICDAAKPQDIDIIHQINQTNKIPIFAEATQKLKCLDRNCNFENDFNEIQCLKCRKLLVIGLEDAPETLMPQKMDEEISQVNSANHNKTDMVICRCCQKENLSSDQYCLYCSEILQKHIPPKSQLDFSSLSVPNFFGLSSTIPLTVDKPTAHNVSTINLSQNVPSTGLFSSNSSNNPPNFASNRGIFGSTKPQNVPSTGLFSSNSSNNPPNFASSHGIFGSTKPQNVPSSGLFSSNSSNNPQNIASNPTGSKISSNCQNSLPSRFSSSSSSQKTQTSSKSTSPKIQQGKETDYYCNDCKSYEREVKKGKGYIYVCQCSKDEAILFVQKFCCNFCFKSLEYGEYEEHAVTCKQREQFYDRNSQAYERCTPLQIQTIMHVNDESEIFHYAEQEELLKRIRKLGYTLKDFVHLYSYIANYAPIIIHMHADKHFTFYLKDTHYRNQFETYKSSGCKDLSIRAGWEDSMFDNMYQNAEPYERVKYGTMNISNDPNGVSVLTGYGKSYFLLKEHVRNRCTMTDMRQTIVSTFRFCNHMLESFTNKELQAAFAGACGKEVKSDGIISEYKEIQIHGPIEFKKDIQRVYVHRDEVDKNPKCLEEIKQFCKNNSVPYELFGEVEKPMQEKKVAKNSKGVSSSGSGFGYQQSQNGSSLSYSGSVNGFGQNFRGIQNQSDQSVIVTVNFYGSQSSFAKKDN